MELNLLCANYECFKCVLCSKIKFKRRLKDSKVIVVADVHIVWFMWDRFVITHSHEWLAHSRVRQFCLHLWYEINDRSLETSELVVCSRDPNMDYVKMEIFYCHLCSLKWVAMPANRLAVYHFVEAKLLQQQQPLTCDLLLMFLFSLFSSRKSKYEI